MARNISKGLALACHLKGRIDDGVVSLMPVYERVLAQLASFDLTEAEGARVHSLSSGLRRVKPPLVSS